MIVQHNLTAMNSNRLLGMTTASQAKSTEKLSSGYKINRAADDASGLSISEKMRKQIRGLTQASANAQDGVSTVQTAEGALTEVHDMLQRMNELAVKASNGTQSETDRAYIQNEIDQLVTEIDRVSTTTKFNEIYLLKGTNGDGTVGKLSYDTASTNVANNFVTDGLNTGDMGTKGSFTISLEVKTGDDQYDTEVTDDDGNNIKVDAKTVTIDRNDADGNALGEDVEYILITSSTQVSMAEAKSLIENNYNGTASSVKVFTSEDDMLAAIKAEQDKTGDVKTLSFGKDAAGNDAIKGTTFADLNESTDISLHVGADSTSDNKIEISLAQLGARGLGINGMKVGGDSSDNADAAIDTIAAAVQKVSTQRSALGAIQNRLEHTMNNLDNIVENTTSAEAAIRDTDMANEMVKYSNNNILSQAGQAMLAQANQSNQGVLSLLQ